jgi:hypothetical protein
LIERSLALSAHPVPEGELEHVSSVAARVREEAKREAQRTVLREAVNRYRHELMSIDERELLWSRIVRLRKQLGLS